MDPKKSDKKSNRRTLKEKVEIIKYKEENSASLIHE